MVGHASSKMQTYLLTCIQSMIVRVHHHVEIVAMTAEETAHRHEALRQEMDRRRDQIAIATIRALATRMSPSPVDLVAHQMIGSSVNQRTAG